MVLYNKILLINFGGIGDEILFSPVINSLKKNYPNAKITLCLESRSGSFTKLTNFLDSFFYIDIKTKNKYIELLKLYFKALTGNYDLVISSGQNPLIPVLLFFTGIKCRIGYHSSFISKLLLTHNVKLNKNQYAAKMYFDLVKPIIADDFEMPHINVPQHAKFPHSVLIHPGVSKISISKKIVKSIDAKKWTELIIKLLEKGKKVFLSGGPDDEETILKIREGLIEADLTNFVDMYEKTNNIYDLAELIKKTEILICSDSAPMHIGVATDTKTIAIFGPTDEKKLIPESEKFIAIKNTVECRPCLWEKRHTTCEELNCLNINTNDIIKFVD